MLIHTWRNGFQMFRFHKLWVTEINFVRVYELQCETYFLVLRLSESLGLLSYGRPFFPIEGILSPSLKIHLLQILLYTFQVSHSRSSPSSTSLRFTLKYVNSPSLIHYYYMVNTFQSSLFNICYCV